MDPFANREILGCGTATMEENSGLGIWEKHSERDLLAAILREYLRRFLGDELKEEISTVSIWDFPTEEPLVSFLIERTGWTPSGFKSTEQLEGTLRSMVAGLDSSGMLIAYTQDWLRSQASGW